MLLWIFRLLTSSLLLNLQRFDRYIYRVRYVTPEEVRRANRPKRCEYNNKDEINSSSILSNKHYQASLKNFRQVISTWYGPDIIHHEKGWRTYRPKRWEYSNKDEVNSSNILSNNNYQASWRKFRQRLFFTLGICAIIARQILLNVVIWMTFNQ